MKKELKDSLVNLLSIGLLAFCEAVIERVSKEIANKKRDKEHD